jgi:hypothetical protein
MKKLILLLVVLASLLGCNSPGKKIEQINVAFDQGNFAQAAQLIDESVQEKSLTDETKALLSYKLDLMERIRLDFSKDEQKVKEELEKYYPGVTDSMLRNWEKLKHLEMRMIDGERRYFKYAVNNLFRVNKEAKALKDSLQGTTIKGTGAFKLRRIPEIFEKNIAIHKQVFDRQDIKINYTLTVAANAVPEGETIRCWLPYGRPGDRMLSVELLGTYPENPVVAPENQMQRTIYLEQKAIKDSATVFKANFVIGAASQWFDIKPEEIKPYDKKSALYKEFTSERLPQITFSKPVSDLAKQIVGNETNPYLQVKKMFYWIDENIPWASALEYSIMPCIPEYVIENGKGDCGMQSLLLISMARSLGIPAKWESGWYLLPEEINLHDWVEIYYEGIGWVPVDPSFGLIDHENIKVKEYYLHGLDSYRFIVNDDYGRELFPPKKHPRSEPIDFQRGEVEWEGGNLYFDKWRYRMEVEYLNK